MLSVKCNLFCWWCVLVAQLSDCHPMDVSPPGSSVHGIFQSRILEWVAISSSRGSSQPRDQTLVSCLFCTTGGFFTAKTLVKPLSIYSVDRKVPLGFSVTSSGNSIFPNCIVITKSLHHYSDKGERFQVA